MPSFKTISDLDVNGKTVFVRADLNVPLKDGVITDTTRIDRTVPTLTALLEKGAKLVVASHFGRPKGKPVPDMSLKPVAAGLEKALGKTVGFVNDCIGPEAEQAVAALPAGGVLMLENLRFHAEEEKNDPEFSAALARLADAYVNDAFSSAHRAHASTEGMAKLLPNAAGLLMQAELEALEKALAQPERPLAALVGGAKVSTKLDLLSNLIDRVDMIVIGGGMANTFLFAQGIEIGKSLCEKDMADTARDVLRKAKEKNCEIVLPTDAVVAKEFAAGAAHATVSISAVPGDQMILDVGPESAQTVILKLRACKTLVWNGPMGAFEIPPFDAATVAVAKAAAELTKNGSLMTVAGGGDTVSALAHAGVEEQFTYVSTAGGAFLEWLEGKTLPGVKAIQH